MRKDEETGKLWFLLQNFWATKYLVVVSGEYMASCRAKISFLKRGGSISLKEEMQVIDAHYSETDIALEEELEEHLYEED